MFDYVKNVIGKLIGLLEFLGLWYPVRHYVAEVSSDLVRGSRPRNMADYRALAKMGVRTCINLAAERDIDREASRELSMGNLRIPVIDNTAPTMSQVWQFLRVLRNHDAGRFFVHCEAGRGRTGTFVACYRISQGWNVERAIAEARKYGLSMPVQEEFIRKFVGQSLPDYLRGNDGQA